MAVKRIVRNLKETASWKNQRWRERLGKGEKFREKQDLRSVKGEHHRDVWLFFPTLQVLYLPEFSQIRVCWVQGWYPTISSSAALFYSLQGRASVNQGSQRGRQWRGSLHRQRAKGIQELGPEPQYPAGRERGLLEIGGAEKKASWKEA